MKNRIIALVLLMLLIGTQVFGTNVGLWRFDENGGTNVFDASGIDNHGRLGDGFNHMPSWVKGQNGSALFFDADSNDYIIIPDSDSIRMDGTGAFTIQCWIKPQAWVHNNRILEKNSYGVWQAVSNGNKLRIQLYFNEDETSKWFYSNGVINVNEWTHIAVTYNGTDVKLYLNLTEDTVVNWPEKTLKGNTDDLIIGNVAALGKPFDGLIYNIKIDNKDVLSPSPISDVIVGFWNFDETNETIVYDRSNYENHGSLGAGSSRIPERASGKFGLGLNFEADDDDYVLIPASESLNMTGARAFTFQFWMRPETWTHNNRIIDKNTYGIWQSNTTATGDLNKMRVQLYFNEDPITTSKWFYTNGVVQMDAWTHVAVTYDGTDIKVYYNGVIDSVVNYPGKTMRGSSDDLIIGNVYTLTTKPFDGIIDEVQVENLDLILRCESGSSFFPADNAHDIELNADLKWPISDKATASYLYFWDSFDDVSDAPDPFMLPGRGKFVNCNAKWKDPYGLEYRTTYYWRVDEVNETTGELWKGQVRQFTTKKYLPQDIDNDSRVDFNDVVLITSKWLDNNDIVEANIHKDGVINWKDFASLGAKWLYSPGTVYYVSSIAGNDNNSGISPQQAWQSLSAVNSRTFNPGDKILFHAGTQYTGRLVLNGSGAIGFPIIVNMYGQGSKPRIDGDPTNMEALLLYNVQYWEINNLEITNTEPHVPDLAGVRVKINDCGKARHIYLRNLYVHDVNAHDENNPYSNTLSKTGYGIIWQNAGSNVPSVFDDLRIENCHVKNINMRGIQGRSGYNRQNWHPNVNIIIRNNLVEQIGGAGITALGTHGALIEYNRVDGIGIFHQGNGIHPYMSDNTIIQYNEVSDCQGDVTEGWAFNSDGNCKNSLFQYNYSHDNWGGFQLVIGDAPCENTVIRYNISQNDGFRTTNYSPTFNISGNCKKTRIYNNTIYVGTRKEPIELIRFVSNSYGSPNNTAFYNNIFFVAGRVTFIWGNSTNNVFSNNAWYGNISAQPSDPYGITSDPRLIDPNSGGSNLDCNWNLLASYKLQSGSPCIRAGIVPPVNPKKYKYGGQDFWGNPVPAEFANPDIGAHQYRQN